MYVPRFDKEQIKAYVEVPTKTMTYTLLCNSQKASLNSRKMIFL